MAPGGDPGRDGARPAGGVAAHPDLLLPNPAPQALFPDFGDSALMFELRSWTAQFENAIRIRSELSVAVSRALAEAGMVIPFPQRDLHVKSVDAGIGLLPALAVVSGSGELP